jgi:hypothetical protein
MGCVETPPALTEEQINQKWTEFVPRINELQARSDKQDGFRAQPRSSMAGDDRWSAPFQVSHAVNACIMAGIDHLHACKALIVDAHSLHVAAPASLVRGSLENMATAFWMLHPASRAERVTRCLRWHTINARDGQQALGSLGLTSPRSHEKRVAAIHAAAEEHGLDVAAVKRGYTSTAAVKYAEEHTASLLGVLLPWQLCSGFAHGRMWATLAFSEREEKPTDDPDVLSVRFSTDLMRALYLVWTAMNLTDELLTLHAQRSTRWC